MARGTAWNPPVTFLRSPLPLCLPVPEEIVLIETVVVTIIIESKVNSSPVTGWRLVCFECSFLWVKAGEGVLSFGSHLQRPEPLGRGC